MLGSLILFVFIDLLYLKNQMNRCWLFDIICYLEQSSFLDFFFKVLYEYFLGTVQ